MSATATMTTANVTVDANGMLMLSPELIGLLRPDGETLTLVDVTVQAGTLVLRRSTIDAEDWWAYTPENRARIKSAMDSPPDQDLRLSQRELERLAGLEPE